MQKRYHDFSFKIFCLTVPKHFVGGDTSVYQKISGIEKFYASEGVSRFSVENFLSHITKKFRWETLRCFRKFRVSQNSMHKKGISLNSVEKFLSHSADKIRRRTLCFERILVSKIFKQKRGEGIENFQAKEGEALRSGTLLCCVSENFRQPKSLWIRKGEYQDFPSKIFCLTVPKNIVGEPFCVSENF